MENTKNNVSIEETKKNAEQAEDVKNIEKINHFLLFGCFM